MTYTFAELQQIWVDAGGSNAPSLAVPGYTDDQVAAAIACAESSGNPASNPYDPTDPPSWPGGNTNPLNYSYGLWQINGNNFAALEALGIPAGRALFNPDTNAQAAIAIQQDRPGFGGSWRNWSTYKHGDFRQYLPGAGPTAVPGAGSGVARVNVPAASQTSPTGTEGASMDPLGLAALETVVAKQVKTLAINTAVVGVGVALLVLGIVWIIASSNAARTIVATAAKAAV